MSKFTQPDRQQITGFERRDVLRIAPEGAKRIPGHALNVLAGDLVAVEAEADRILRELFVMRADIKLQKRVAKLLMAARRARYDLSIAADADKRA